MLHARRYVSGLKAHQIFLQPSLDLPPRPVHFKDQLRCDDTYKKDMMEDEPWRS